MLIAQLSASADVGCRPLLLAKNGFCTILTQQQQLHNSLNIDRRSQSSHRNAVNNTQHHRTTPHYTDYNLDIYYSLWLCSCFVAGLTQQHPNSQPIARLLAVRFSCVVDQCAVALSNIVSTIYLSMIYYYQYHYILLYYLFIYLSVLVCLLLME